VWSFGFLPVERQFTLSLAITGDPRCPHVARTAPPGSLGTPWPNTQRPPGCRGQDSVLRPRGGDQGRLAAQSHQPGPLVFARPAVTTMCRMINSRQESRTNPVYLFGADVT
jgi:hypothetical protein